MTAFLLGTEPATIKLPSRRELRAMLAQPRVLIAAMIAAVVVVGMVLATIVLLAKVGGDVSIIKDLALAALALLQVVMVNRIKQNRDELRELRSKVEKAAS